MIISTHLLFDFSLLPLAMMMTFITVVGWFFISVAVVFLEGLVLRLLRWDTWRRSLIDALLMNISSALFGCVATMAVVPSENTAGRLAVLVGGWVLSVGIEGVVLTIVAAVRKKENRSAALIWLASLLANTASYLLLSAVALGFTLFVE